MVVKILFLTLLMTVGIMSIPQGYNSPPQRAPVKAPSCRTTYKTVSDVVYEEITEKNCQQKYQRICATKYKRECNDYRDRVCRQVYEKKCTNQRKQECREEYKNVNEPYTEDVCKDEWNNECEQAWTTNGYGEKVWEDDPATCKDVKRTKCNPVQKQRVKRVPYQKCEWNTYQDCKNVPSQKCDYVTKQNCENKPYEDCKNQPYQECHDEHKKIPKQVTRQVPVRVCDGDTSTSSTSGNGYNAQDVDSIFDVRGAADDYDQDYEINLKSENDESSSSSSTPKKLTKASADAVVFG